MNEKFHQSSHLSNEKMKELLERRDQPALTRFILLFSLFVALSILIVLSWSGSILILLSFLILYGILCCSMFACLHETIHNTLPLRRHG